MKQSLTCGWKSNNWLYQSKWFQGRHVKKNFGGSNFWYKITFDIKFRNNYRMSNSFSNWKGKETSRTKRITNIQNSKQERTLGTTKLF